MSTHTDAVERAALAADAKHGPDGTLPCPFCAALMRPVHAAVTVACTGPVDRRTIERRLRLGRFALDEMMSCKPRMVPFDALARMLLDPTVLGVKAHAMIRQMLMQEMGVLAIEHIRHAVPGRITEEALDVFDAAGTLAGEIREATDEDSPGGSAVTPCEHRRIGAHAMAVVSEATQLMPGRDSQ